MRYSDLFVGILRKSLSVANAQNTPLLTAKARFDLQLRKETENDIGVVQKSDRDLKEKFTVGNNTIYMFDPQIYPRILWISITKDTLSDRFNKISEWDESCDASVDHVYDKIDKLGGFIIRFESLDAIDTSNIIHESNHVVFEIFSYCDCKLDSDNQEPFCYLAGWVAKCCEEVLKLERRD